MLKLSISLLLPLSWILALLSWCLHFLSPLPTPARVRLSELGLLLSSPLALLAACSSLPAFWCAGVVVVGVEGWCEVWAIKGAGPEY